MYSMIRADTWFSQYPEKILGEQIETNQFRRPISVKGDKNLIDTIAADIHLPVPAKHYRSAMSTEKARARAIALRLIAQAKLKGDLGRTTDKAARSKAASGLLDFRSAVKKYNPNLTETELQVWVWWNEAQGTPLSGDWQNAFGLSRYARRALLRRQPLRAAR